MGGGGFLMEPENPLLDEYLLAQTQKRKPAICFIPTASGDAESFLAKFYSAFKQHHCRPSHLSLFRPPRDLEAFVRAQDAVYVGGGNTKCLLALWRDWGLDRILRNAWRRGTVLGGISAGSICWFEQGLTDSFTGRLAVLPCLGFLPGSHSPHYDGEPERRPAYRRLIGSGELQNGVAAEDGVALHFLGRTLAAVVASRRNAAAYVVRKTRNGVTETKLAAQYLGNTNVGASLRADRHR